MTVTETDPFVWTLNDPGDLAAWSRVAMRRRPVLRLLSNRWLGLVPIGLFALLLTVERGLQTWFSATLLAALLLGWAASNTAWLLRPLRAIKRPGATPTTPRMSGVVRLAPDGVGIVTRLLPERLIPWSTLDVLEREGGRLVFVFRLAPLMSERLIVPQRAFADAEAFAEFCEAAAYFAAGAGKTRVFVTGPD